MARLVYSAICSLDGYVNDAAGRFDWAAPDAAVHAHVNDRERGIGTYLYGRRIYETMRVWQDEPSSPDAPAEIVDYADVWRAADKIVFSTTLAEVTTPRTTLRRSFDPAFVSDLVAGAATDVSFGGTTLAGQALRAGLVDEIGLYLVPTIVGGGTRALPDDVRLDLQLRDEHRFAGGTVFLRYDVRR